VESVTWQEAVQFCLRLSARPDESKARRTYRLPTEAEWEYAARTGSQSKWSFGDDSQALGEYAWFSGNADKATHPVGQKRPNAWGLHDIYGNVWEHCWDWYAKDAYQQSPSQDPAGPPSGNERIHRGGGWDSSASRARCGARGTLPPSARMSFLGFRVVCDIAGNASAGAAKPSAPAGGVKPSATEKPAKPPPKPGRHTADSPAKKQLANSIGMEFVLIPAGEFMMGAAPEEIEWAQAETKKKPKLSWALDRIAAAKPQHQVRISRPFYLGVYEVTQSEYERVMQTNPSEFSAKGKEAAKVAGQDTSRHPVEKVRWVDAAQFCQRLSALPQEQAARRMYRLPTEAEWEYAARAGSTTKWLFGDDPAALGEYAWFSGNWEGKTHPVGQKKPSPWGLYDVYGNVLEFCLDWYGQDYYEQSARIDPTGPTAGTVRVARGGAAPNPLQFCRSAFRNIGAPTDRGAFYGFRVVLVHQ
jgi:formylglycine-generating enzyme required for sulfatase activity